MRGNVVGSRKGKLTELQSDALEEIARRTPGFFLTGGAVLVGFTLGHRFTDDLDFFTNDDVAMQTGDAALRGAASALGATLETTTTSPDFRRYVLSRGNEGVRVDLVRDRTPPLRPRVVRDGIPMDATEEIFANKIAALVGRSEVRDLVDLMALERTGLRVEDFIADAQKKDGGATPATIAWLLSSIHAPENPDGADRSALEAFIRSLEERMLSLSSPAK